MGVLRVNIYLIERVRKRCWGDKWRGGRGGGWGKVGEDEVEMNYKEGGLEEERYGNRREGEG
jgi:hypothetical protein